MENWLVINKGADFNGIARKFGISPILARLMRNREVTGDAAIRKYLYGTLDDLYDPHLLKDADLLCEKLSAAIDAGKKIRVIGDYDIDGVMSTYILCKGIRRCGGIVDYQIPDRILDGYGINEHLIDKAFADGVSVIVTCDNGIAALPEIAHAKALGMTVLVTDHHEIPFIEEAGNRQHLRSEADAIVNPKQPDCRYPFDSLCGAAVAYKVMQVFYDRCGIPLQETEVFLENVAFATVGDVMDLTDENRILVREGLRRIAHTHNAGMRALILQNKLDPARLSAYHFGFVLGPCINASGRLDTAKYALELFLEEDAPKAAAIAAKLVELNEMRKDMTRQGVEQAICAVEQGMVGTHVFVINLPDVHESLAGIIAGRVREKYNRPTFVLTRSGDGIKGSGRSVEGYSMYEEMCQCRQYFTKFGGHPMAAGLSMEECNVDAFRRQINQCCRLTDEDFIPKIRIDIAMPAGYPTIELIREMEQLAPFGKGNAKPLFADKNITIERAWIVGINQNVLRLTLRTEYQERIFAVYFGDLADFKRYYSEKYSAAEVERAFLGQANAIRMAIVYEPQINSYQGTESVQLVIRNYR